MVVRVEIPSSKYIGRPIIGMEGELVLALLVKQGSEQGIIKLLQHKGMHHTAVFGLL
jgi:hypothetical protein